VIRLALMHDAGGDTQTLGYLDIVDDGTGMPRYPNYVCALLDSDLHALRHAQVSHYPAYHGMWELVSHALRALNTRGGLRGSATIPVGEW
jgi:hypothetical protein